MTERERLLWFVFGMIPTGLFAYSQSNYWPLVAVAFFIVVRETDCLRRRIERLERNQPKEPEDV